MPAAFEAPPPRGLATQTPRPDRPRSPTHTPAPRSAGGVETTAPVVQAWSAWPSSENRHEARGRSPHGSPKKNVASRRLFFIPNPLTALTLTPTL
jgi:hypothetical protein